MTEQRDLFTEAHARTSDPATSHEAAARVALSDLELLTLCVIREAGSKGMTTKEIAAAVSMPRDSISPRIAPLRARGKVEASGERRERATVWVAV